MRARCDRGFHATDVEPEVRRRARLGQRVGLRAAGGRELTHRPAEAERRGGERGADQDDADQRHHWRACEAGDADDTGPGDRRQATTIRHRFEVFDHSVRVLDARDQVQRLAIDRLRRVGDARQSPNGDLFA